LSDFCGSINDVLTTIGATRFSSPQVKKDFAHTARKVHAELKIYKDQMTELERSGLEIVVDVTKRHARCKSRSA